MYSTVPGAAPTGRRQRAVVSDEKGINFDSLNQVCSCRSPSLPPRAFLPRGQQTATPGRRP